MTIYSLDILLFLFGTIRRTVNNFSSLGFRQGRKELRNRFSETNRNGQVGMMVWSWRTRYATGRRFLFILWLMTNNCYALGSGEGNGTPLQYSCLENLMDGGAWYTAVHGVVKSQTRLSDFTLLFTFMHWRRKWQPTPVFLPGESQGWRSLVNCRTESDKTEAT